MKNYELEDIADIIILESFFSENNLVKTADLSSALPKVKNWIVEYVKSNYDPERPFGSIMNFLTPALFNMFGFKWFSVLLSLSKVVFGVNFTGIFESIKNYLSSFFTKNKKINVQDLNNMISSTVEEHFNSGVIDDSSEAIKKVLSFNQQLRDAQLLKVFAQDIVNKYDNLEIGVIKEAGLLGGAANLLKGKSAGIFGKIISWIVRLLLKAAGLLAIGGVAGAVLGKKPIAKQKGVLPTEHETASAMLPTPKTHNLKMADNSTQFTILHENDMYNVWIEKNTTSSIKEQLANWAIELYPQLTDKKDIIFSSPSFQSILNAFLTVNKENASLIVVPKTFTSIKQIVDYFVGDIADKVKVALRKDILLNILLQAASNAHIIA